MKALGLRTAIYKVPNLLEAKEWYKQVFEVEPNFENERYIGFTVAGFELGLHLEETEVKIKEDTVLTYWGVDDIEAEFQHLVLAGAEIHEAPMNVGGEIVTASVKDPWGNVIGLIYNPEFKLG